VRSGDALTATLRFDTAGGEVQVPALTSFAVLDGAGRHTATLPANGNGALVFSARHHDGAGVFFRRRGRLTWVQLSPVRVAEDETHGIVYRVDLEDAIRIGGEIELSVELVSGAGHSAVFQITPAFATSAAAPVRRRAVRP
jgi:hypothetical protein